MSEAVKVEVSRLEGAALDWAVAKAECPESFVDSASDQSGLPFWSEGWLRGGSPSRDWRIGGNLIERHKIDVVYRRTRGEWAAILQNANFSFSDARTGSTPLIAAMRTLVASKLGSEIEIPAELVSK